MESIQLIGLAYEGRDNALPGASTGAALMRWGRESAEDYSLWQHAPVPVVEDMGDRYFLDLEPAEALSAMEAALGELLDPARPFLILGGDHFVTLPVIQWLAREGRRPWVVQLDAHLDRRETHEGRALSHATVIRRVEERLGEPRVHAFGIRSRAPQEPWDPRRMHFREVAAPLGAFLERVPEQDPIYLTFDLDVLDPAWMPAVSNPEPDGIGLAEAVEALRLLRGRLVGADLVELAGPVACGAGPAQRAGIVLRELLIALAG